MELITTETTSAVLVPNGVKLCDRPGCTEPATYGYVWHWGERGHCCDTHQFLLNQAAENIGRGIMFSPLNPDATPPVENPERIALLSGKLAAEAESSDTKQRNAKLYQQNVELTRQVQTLTLQKRSADSALTVAEGRLQTVTRELEQLQATAAEWQDELSRLRLLADIEAEGETRIEGPGTQR